MPGPNEIPVVDGIDGLHEVGQGGFATVYRGRQPAFHRDVAVKVLLRSGLDGGDRRRFERECQAMGTLSNHPGIVTLFDAGFTADQRPYIVMAYVPDGSLEDRLSSGPMPAHEVADVGVRLAGALETAHRAGVIHRDVKPANVLRSEYGVQLGDFGIARLQGGHETRSGVITASVAHAAPEILEGHPPGVGADVYSLGSTMYMALTGSAAFVRNTDEALLGLIRRVLADPIPDLRDRGVPDALATTIEKAMSKDPANRYATAGAFGLAIRDAQASLGFKETDLLIVGGTNQAVAPGPAVAQPPIASSPNPATMVLPTGDGRMAEPRPILAAPLAAPPADPAEESVSANRWLVPVGIGVLVAAVIGVFALWPRADSTAGPVTAPTGVPATVVGATTAPTSVGNTTAVIGRDSLTEAEVVETVDVAADSTVEGLALSAIDGASFDPERGQLLLTKEPAPVAVREATPELADPAVFTIPLAAPDDGSLIDLGAATAATLLGPDGTPYGLELDVEGMAVLDDGSFYVVSEGTGEIDSVGGPFVHRFNPDGTYLSQLQLPEWYLPDAEGTRGFSPNRGLHGIARRPGAPEQVVLAVEGPLIQDHDPDDRTAPKVARLVGFDVASGEAVAEWGYPLDQISSESIAANETAESRIVDIADAGNGSLIVVELTDTEVLLYLVNLDGGTTPSAGLPRTLEKSPITVLGDSDDPFLSMTAGPPLADGRTSVLLVSNNNFTDEPTRITMLGITPGG